LRRRIVGLAQVKGLHQIIESAETKRIDRAFNLNGVPQG
jgi:hypothetical protein